ncbi:hypothetical protein BaRGS_00033148, partial [Batillaria attramentaria]
RMEKTMQDQIKQQEKEVDSLEGFSGRNNLKFIGIRESAKQNYTACAQTMVDVLNQHSTRRTWTIDDVERARRVGPRKGKQSAATPPHCPLQSLAGQDGKGARRRPEAEPVRQRDKGSSQPDQATESRDRAGQERGQVWLLMIRTAVCMSRTDATPGTSKTPGSGQTSAHPQTKRTSEMRGTGSSRGRCWQAATATTTEMTTIAANRHCTATTP